MKKHILQLIFLVLVIPAIGQFNVYISGYVTDSLTGYPISNHTVSIYSDSTLGFIYNNMVQTDGNGFYQDTISLPSGSIGKLFIMTYGCDWYLHKDSIDFDSTAYNFTLDFSICDPNGCVAFFSHTHYPDRVFYFQDGSTGDPTDWFWTFGDGGFSTEQNPSHQYATIGWYYVILIINNPSTGCQAIYLDSIFASDTGCHADFAYSYPVNTTVPTHFTDMSVTSGGQVNSWYWVFGDPGSGTNNTSELQNPVHLFSSPGPHEVCLYIIGSDSCYDEKCMTIDVGSINPIVVNISGKVVNTSNGNPAPFHPVTWGIPEDTLEGPHTIYTDIDGNYSDSITLPAGMISGTFYVWTQYCNYILELSSDFGPANYNIHQDLNIGCDENQVCQAKIGMAATGPLTVQFSDASTGDPKTWLWDFGDGNTSDLQNPIHTYINQQDYNVSLSIGNDSTGCNSTATKQVYFVDSVLCNASYTYSTTANPLSIQFQNQSSGVNGVWHWNFGDGDTSTVENPVHTYRFPGKYLVYLTIGDYTMPCWQTCVKAISVSDSIPGCQSYFTYTNGPIGVAYSIQFTDQSEGDPAGWLWDFGDSTYSTEENPVHVFPGAGNYTVCLTILGNNCSDTYCTSVTADSIIYHQVYGQVFAGNFPLMSGQAMISSLDTMTTFAPFIATCPIDTNGVYYFTLVPDGQYLIYAIPTDNTGYLPTYYGDAVNWQEAVVLNLGEPSNPYNINLIPAQDYPGGQGSISGQVNLPAFKYTMLDQIVMLLMNENGKVIYYDPLSESGDFEFINLDYGTYYLHAELAGTLADDVKVILTQEESHADIVMTFSGKNILGTVDENHPPESVRLYPNPARDEVNISIKSTSSCNINIAVSDSRGQVVLHNDKPVSPGVNNILIPISNVASGFYLLRITSGNGLNLTKKLIIVR